MRPARLGAYNADSSQKVRNQRVNQVWPTPHGSILSERVPAPGILLPTYQKGEWNMFQKNLVIWVTLVLLSLGVGMQGENPANCSNATLHGSYAFHATGERFAAVARFTFDGRGGFTAIFFGRTPGNPFGFEFSGTYSVDSNCIVTDEWADGSIHHSVIYGEGKGYFILNSTPSSAEGDTVNSGEARRQ
jgi:hypothetical protein